MGSALSAEEETLLDRALHAARDTRFLVVEPGARHDAARGDYWCQFFFRRGKAKGTLLLTADGWRI